MPRKGKRRSGRKSENGELTRKIAAPPKKLTAALTVALKVVLPIDDVFLFFHEVGVCSGDLVASGRQGREFSLSLF